MKRMVDNKKFNRQICWMLPKMGLQDWNST